MLKHLYIFVIIFISVNIVRGNSICQSSWVEINEEFISCCQGKPTFTSEDCVDALETNNTLSHECVVECMYKDYFKIYNGKDIDLDAAKTFLDSNLIEEDIKEMFVNAFAACKDMANRNLLHLFAVEEKNDFGCDEYPAMMDRCVWYHTLSHCPERMGRFNQEKCAAKVKWVEMCIKF